MRAETAASVIGWDIGGAHVKACLCIDGEVGDTLQCAAPLWQGLEHLDAAIAQARARWPQFATARHALTMTAEMTDLFDDRATGVRELSARLARLLGSQLHFYAGFGADAGQARWLSAPQAGAQWRAIASANWLASADFIGRRIRNAILVDIGSTTTDLIPVVDGRPAPAGRSDAERLASGELVYLGVVRTPLCALGAQVPFGGEHLNVMNEFFATTADVFRLSGELDAAHDQHPAADGGSKDEVASCRRLARMIGHDLGDADTAAWKALAMHWRGALLAEIGRNLARVRARQPELDDATIIGAGCGRFLAAELAERAGMPFQPFAALAKPAQLNDANDAGPDWIATCAPCVAVARLLAADARSANAACRS